MRIEPPFESRRQLIACLKQHSRHGNVVGVVYIVLFFGVMFGNAVFGARISASGPVLQTVHMVSLAVVVLLQFPLLYYITKRGVDRFGLRCPACRKPLIATPGRIAVATGRCGECGSRIWPGGQEIAERRECSRSSAEPMEQQWPVSAP